MYKDIIHYELAENITEAHLIAVGKQIVEDWMKNLPGFISWEITKAKKGGYVDIVCWQTEEAAKNAEKEMANIPNSADWYACYKPGSIRADNTSTIAVF